MKFLCFFFLIACFSCSNQSLTEKDKSTNDGVEYIKVKPDEINKEYAKKTSTFIDSISYIPLETADECLLVGIDRIIFQNDKFYIYDRKGNQLCLFSSDGKFITKIGKKGHGPGEYVKIEAFYVDSLDNTFIYCEYKQSILEYDKNAKFIGEKNVGLTIADFTVYRNRMLFYTGIYRNSSSEVQSRLIALCDNERRINFLKWKFTDLFLKYYGTTNDRLFYKNRNTLFLIEEIGNSVYQISDSIPMLRYKIDFGKNTIPIDFKTEVMEETIEVQMKNKCKLKTFVECDDYVYLSFSKKYVFNAFYFKQKQQVINLGPFLFYDVDNIIISNIIASSTNNKLIGFGESFEFKEFVENTEKSSLKVKKISEKMTETDNPIIYIISLKN